MYYQARGTVGAYSLIACTRADQLCFVSHRSVWYASPVASIIRMSSPLPRGLVPQSNPGTVPHMSRFFSGVWPDSWDLDPGRARQLILNADDPRGPAPLSSPRSLSCPLFLISSYDFSIGRSPEKRAADGDLVPSSKRARSDSSPLKSRPFDKKGKWKAEENEGVKQVLAAFEDELTCPMYVFPKEQYPILKIIP
jgi:hypothetical protein